MYAIFFRMIIIEHLTKNFGAQRILDDFSYTFPRQGAIALVGANGAGKTTFLNMLSGQEEYDAGRIIIPKDCVLAYLPQTPCANPKGTILAECVSGSEHLCALQDERDRALLAMQEAYSDEAFEKYERVEKKFTDKGGYALEANAKGILSGLGFENDQFDESPHSLSGGWKMRLELAKLLINEPNFLLLDEPTNHLDLPSLIWLEHYLRSFRGTLLFVSHDRDFINNLSDMTMHLVNGNLRVYNGDFDAFLHQKAERSKQALQEKENLQKKQNHMQSFVDRFRYKATKAKQAQSRLKMIERLKMLESKLDIEEPEKHTHFQMTVEKPSGKTVLTIQDGTIGYAREKPLSQNIHVHIQRGNKIVIVGANGIGKSTLLKSIVGEIPLLKGTCELGFNVSIGYYAQNQLDILDPDLNVLENVMRLAPHITPQQARSLLGSLLITKDNVSKLVKVLSGGEKSKVAIAALLAQRNNFLILDEPTNHLDMTSAETLAQALASYDGTVLAVSHNRAFINAFATHLLRMDRFKKPELIGHEVA